jgi:hypothetical protein
MARKVVAATLREAARAITQASHDLEQPWAMDLATQLRALAHHIITSDDFGK